MKKILLTSILSSIFLSGCGGDSDKKTDSGLSGKWTAYYNNGYQTDDYINISEGNLSVYEWGERDISLFNVIQEYNDTIWDYEGIDPNFLMGKNGLTSDILDWDSGEILLGKISKTSNNTWQIKPQANEGKNGLTFNLKATKKDLTDVAYNTIFNSSNITDTFPKGAACLVPISLKSNEDFIIGDAQSYDDDNSFYNYFSDLYYDLSNNNLLSKTFIYGAKFKVDHITTFGFNYGYLSGVVDNENFSGIGLHATSSQNLIYNYDLGNLTTEADIEANDQCVYFNEKATEFLDNLAW